jgi:GTP-binding protein
MFRDKVRIEVFAGNGGDGIVSFRREKGVPRGGPDGGDGGHGGGVYIYADPNCSHLGHLRKRHYRAEHGERGGSGGCHGANGEDVVIHVAPGTQVRNEEHELLFDLEPGQKVCVASGGIGGLGNIKYKTSTHQVPYKCKVGTAGQLGVLRLRLRLNAQFGLIGAPNAGKSSLLNVISNADVKTGEYAFTTIIPNIGMTESKLSVIDIPGLIEGASSGKGLGAEFLDHIAKCSALICILDASDRPDEIFGMLMHELQMHDHNLPDRVKLVVLNKSDLCEVKDFQCEVDTVSISVKDKTGIEELLRKISAIAQTPQE